MPNSQIQDDHELPILKMVIIGESGVGKTNIISRYTLDKFHICNNATVGVEFVSKPIQLQAQQFLLQIWDTAGQERFRALNRSFYRNALGAIVAFSLGDHDSFQKLPKWIEQLRQNVDQTVVLLLVGNKCDLKEQKVSVTEATQFARKQKMAYLQISAALNINIETAFQMLANKIYQLNKQKLYKSEFVKRYSVLESIKSNNKNNKKKSKCCQ